MLKKLKKDYEILKNKVRFITGIINQSIKLQKVKKQAIIQML